MSDTVQHGCWSATIARSCLGIPKMVCVSARVSQKRTTDTDSFLKKLIVSLDVTGTFITQIAVERSETCLDLYLQELSARWRNRWRILFTHGGIAANLTHRDSAVIKSIPVLTPPSKKEDLSSHISHKLVLYHKKIKEKRKTSFVFPHQKNNCQFPHRSIIPSVPFPNRALLPKQNRSKSTPFNTLAVDPALQLTQAL